MSCWLFRWMGSKLVVIVTFVAYEGSEVGQFHDINRFDGTTTMRHNAAEGPYRGTRWSTMGFVASIEENCAAEVLLPSGAKISGTVYLYPSTAGNETSPCASVKATPAHVNPNPSRLAPILIRTSLAGVPSGAKTTNLTGVLFNGGGSRKSHCARAVSVISTVEAAASLPALGQYCGVKGYSKVGGIYMFNTTL